MRRSLYKHVENEKKDRDSDIFLMLHPFPKVLYLLFDADLAHTNVRDCKDFSFLFLVALMDFYCRALHFWEKEQMHKNAIILTYFSQNELSIFWKK